MRLRILEEYNKFREATMHPNCSKQQIRDMKIAFHAGSMASLQIVFNLQSNEIITAEDTQMVKDLIAEINKFTKDVREGVI